MPWTIQYANAISPLHRNAAHPVNRPIITSVPPTNLMGPATGYWLCPNLSTRGNEAAFSEEETRTGSSARTAGLFDPNEFPI